MTFFDFFVLAVVGASVASGAMRGLVRALVASAALVAGLFLAAHAYGAAGALLLAAGLVESPEAASAGGFLLVAGLVLGAGFVAGSYLRSGLGRSRLGWLDRALGAAFGMARGVAVCSCIYLALTAFPVRLEPVADAKTGPALAAGARLLSLCTSEDVRARFQAEYRRLFAQDLSFSSRAGGN
jgi:membrane protein required for colicin V production